MTSLRTKCANIVLASGVVFSIIGTGSAVYQIVSHSWAFHEIPILFRLIVPVGAIATIFFSCALKLEDARKVNLSLILVSIFVPIFSFEAYHQLSIETPPSLEQNNSPVYPNYFPQFLLDSSLTTPGGEIFPLGGISNTTTTLGNENGYYAVVKTDQHGFNNQNVIYKRGAVEIVIIGDSFAEGYSVYPNQNIGAVLRTLGHHTISLGKGGSGPLLELAIVKEYAAILQPKIVVWLYYVNDLANLNHELESRFIRKYLTENNFSQNLIERQSEIDSSLKKFVGNEVKNYRKRKHNVFIRIIKFEYLRKMFDLLVNTGRSNDYAGLPSPESESTFKTILKTTDQLVSGWDGSLYFVYLPSIFYNSDPSEITLHKFVLATVADLGIPIIDIQEDVFRHHSDPLSLFPYRRPGHYNAKGYRLVADTISRRVRNDFVSR